MRSSEWLSLSDFRALTALAWLRPLPASRRLQISAIGVAMGVAILRLPRFGPGLVRDWCGPMALVLAGYYLSGRFFVSPSTAFEHWLMSWDLRLLGDPTKRFARWPGPLLAYLEIVYMGCFLLPPAGFAALVLTGRAGLADRYWTMVMGAEFGAFASLSLIQSRPPWLIERRAVLPDRAIHRLASQMVEHFTIRANTFPSGHVAGSLAVAFALLGPMPWVGIAMLFLAGTISVACIVGRYHYVVDGVAGAALALFVWAIVFRFGP